jgi:hypothetical protein
VTVRYNDKPVRAGVRAAVNPANAVSKMSIKPVVPEECWTWATEGNDVSDVKKEVVECVDIKANTSASVRSGESIDAE